MTWPISRRARKNDAGGHWNGLTLGVRRAGPGLVASLGVAAAVVLRGAFLDERQMFKDEGASWLLSSYPVADLITHTMSDVYPPLYALALHFWMGAFGDSISAMRSLSVVLGMVVVLVAWRWGHEALGRNWGLVVLLVVGLSGIAVEASREIRMHVLEVACATAAWWLTWRLAQRSASAKTPIWPQLMVLAVAVAGELWTSPMGLPTVALQIVFASAVWVRSRDRAAGLTVSAIAAGALTFLPWLPAQLSFATSGAAFWSDIPGPLLLPYAFDTQLVGRGHLRVVAISAGMILLAIAAIGLLDLHVGRSKVATESRGRDRLLGWTIAFGMALIPAVWLYSQVRSVWDVNYFGNTLAPLALALGAGGRAIARRWHGREFEVLLAVGAIVVAVQGLSAVQRLQDRIAGIDLTPAVQVHDRLVTLVEHDDIVLAIDSRSSFVIDYLVNRRVEPLPLSAPLLTWDNGHEPFFLGQGLVAPGRLLDAEAVEAMGGWSTAFPGLARGGRVVLIDLEDDDTDAIGFGPLDAGQFRQDERIDVAYAGRVAQIRMLALVSTP